jgi:hypothetical protein
MPETNEEAWAAYAAQVPGHPSFMPEYFGLGRDSREDEIVEARQAAMWNAAVLERINQVIGDPQHPKHRGETYDDLAYRIIGLADAAESNALDELRAQDRKTFHALYLRAEAAEVALAAHLKTTTTGDTDA